MTRINVGLIIDVHNVTKHICDRKLTIDCYRRYNYKTFNVDFQDIGLHEPCRHFLLRIFPRSVNKFQYEAVMRFKFYWFVLCKR